METEKDDKTTDAVFRAALVDVQAVMASYKRDSVNQASWLTYYVDKVGVKVVKFSLGETRERFLQKLERVYDTMIMSWYVVRVVNPGVFSETHLDNTVNQKKRVTDTIRAFSNSEWILFLDQLKENRYGLN